MLLAIYGSLITCWRSGPCKIACVVFRQLINQMATLVIDEYVDMAFARTPGIARREAHPATATDDSNFCFEAADDRRVWHVARQLDRHVALASTDDFLVLDGAIVCGTVPLMMRCWISRLCAAAADAAGGERGSPK